MLNKEDPLEMVDLVEQSSSQQSLPLHAGENALEVECLHDHQGWPLDLLRESGDTETPFLLDD